MDYPLRTIAAHIKGECSGNEAITITGVNALELAQPGELTFAEHEKHVPLVRQTQASAIIVPLSFPGMPDKNLLRVAHPRLAFLKVMALFQPQPALGTGVDPHAVVAPDAVLGDGVTIRQCAVIGSQARIGPRTVIESGVHIGAGVIVGESCFIGPNVVIMRGCHVGHRVSIHGGTVIGGDGFGYVWAEGHHVKVPQLGNVIIEDDVEIGCNVCVDRATLGSTIIRRGTKIDNLVQIAHNDTIGEDVIITGQVGLSGSVTVGNRVVFGGQAGVIDHVTIGDGARVGAGTPVIRDVKPGETVWGFPARPEAQAKREIASLTHLPRLLPQVRALRVQLDQVASRLALFEQTHTTLPPRRAAWRVALQTKVVALGQRVARMRRSRPLR